MKKQYISNTLLLIGSIFFLVVSPIKNKVEASESTTLFSEDTQQYIEEETQKYPEIKPYIDNTIEVFSEQENITSEELDELIRESVEEAVKTQNKVETELKTLEQKYAEEASLENLNMQPQVDIPNASVLARSLYDTGIGLVRNYGHHQTAAYMEHGIVPIGQEGTDWRPSTYFSTENDWARRVATDDSLTSSFFGRFEEEIASQGKEHGVISDTHTFMYGELRSSLQTVSYTATFSRRTDGAYNVSVHVSDVFDFEWNLKGYDNFELNFGNNYAAMMEDLGLIKPYQISIYYTM